MQTTVFSGIVAGGDYLFFRTKGGRLFEGGDYFKYCSLEVVPKYIVLFSHKNSSLIFRI